MDLIMDLLGFDTYDVMIIIAILLISLVSTAVKAKLKPSKTPESNQTAQASEHVQQKKVRKFTWAMEGLLNLDWPEEFKAELQQLGANLGLLTGVEKIQQSAQEDWSPKKKQKIAQALADFYIHGRREFAQQWAELDAQAAQLWAPFAEFAASSGTRIPNGMPICVPEMAHVVKGLAKALPDHPFFVVTQELVHASDSFRSWHVAHAMGRCLWRQMPSLEPRLRDLLGEQRRPYLPRWNKDHSQVLFDPEAAFGAWLECCFADFWVIWQFGADGARAFADILLDTDTDEWTEVQVDDRRFVGIEPPLLVRGQWILHFLRATGGASSELARALDEYDVDHLEFPTVFGDFYELSLEEILKPARALIDKLLRPDCALFGHAPLTAAPQKNHFSKLAIRYKNNQTSTKNTVESAEKASPHASSSVVASAKLGREDVRQALILRELLSRPSSRLHDRSRVCSL